MSAAKKEKANSGVSPLFHILGVPTCILLPLLLVANGRHIWEFSIRHPGIIAVLVAVGGEVYFDWREAGVGTHARWKKFFMVLIIAGLSYELIEAANEDVKLGELEKAAAVIRSQNLELQSELASVNSQTEQLRSKNINLENNIQQVRSSNNVVAERLDKSIAANVEIAGRLDQSMAANVEIASKLDKSIISNIELEMALFPRHFEWGFQTVAKLKEQSAGTPCEIVYTSPSDSEQQALASEILSLLGNAGWKINITNVGGSGVTGVTIVYNAGFVPKLANSRALNGINLLGRNLLNPISLSTSFSISPGQLRQMPQS